MSRALLTVVLNHIPYCPTQPGSEAVPARDSPLAEALGWILQVRLDSRVGDSRL